MKTFEFKSQICTTKEQSERLLALGLKKESADMWYPHFASTYPIPLTEDDVMTDRDIPAWSLHRLLVLLDMNIDFDDFDLDNAYEVMIMWIADAIKREMFNHDYLEESQCEK